MPDEQNDCESVATLLEAALDERALRYSSIDALDQKAGVLLAIDGLMVGVTSFITQLGVRILVGSFLAVSAFVALQALALSKYPGLNILHFRNSRLSRPSDETRLVLLDTLIDHLDTIKEMHAKKAKRVRRSMILAAIGIVALAALTVSKTS